MKKIFKLLLVFIITLLFPIFVSAKEKVTLYLFHGDGCPHCAAEIRYLDSIEKKYKNLEIVKYEVWYNKENASLLQDVYKAYGITRNGVPTTIIGNTVIQGFGDTTGNKLERAIKFYNKNEYIDQVDKIKNCNFYNE